MSGTPQVTTLVVRDGSRPKNSLPFYSAFPGRGNLDSVDFHLLIESGSTEAEALCQRALDSLQDSLTGGGRTSLTTVLQEAFQACHKELEARTYELHVSNDLLSVLQLQPVRKMINYAAYGLQLDALDRYRYG